MTTHHADDEGVLALSRRSALRPAAVTGALATAPAILAESEASAASSITKATATVSSSPSPMLWKQPERLGAPPNSGLHLTFGADPSREMTVSWGTAASVSNPRVRFGTPDGGFGDEVRAETVTYIDGESKIESYIHHAKLTRLSP